MPVIGYLSSGSPETDNIPGRLPAFRQGLNEMGYFDGQNVAIEYRGAQGQNDRLPDLASDLVRRRSLLYRFALDGAYRGVSDSAELRLNELPGHGGTIGRDFQHVNNRLSLLRRQSIARGADWKSAALWGVIGH